MERSTFKVLTRKI